jgi:glyoxylase-like metal-dependent hydrolase (beta-lactamase superfamily II)
MRAQLTATPIERVKLSDTLTMLAGPGGNVVVMHGAEGKFVVDGFVTSVWTKLKEVLDGISKAPIAMLIDTHWHFDHADNNANFRKAGAAVLAHENTKTRLTQSHDLLGMHFDPAPADALPTQTFKDVRSIDANGERFTVAWLPPAHTDTDIYVRFAKSNVLHLGDVFFNGTYPFVDTSTGGNIDGMIGGATAGLKLSDPTTKIVPGHGPLADRPALLKYRDMLVTVRDRVQKLKRSGQTLEQVVASAPTADLDPVWGKGFWPPKEFVAMVYRTVSGL